MQKVYATFPLTGAGPPPMAAAVITRVQQLIEAVLVEAADATGRQLPVPNLPGVAASLSVLRATEAGNPIFLTRMVAPVVRMLNNHARQQGSLILQQQQAAQAQGMSQAQAQLVAAQSLQATQSGVVPDPKTAASRPAAAGGKPPITATLLERLNAVDDSKAAEWDPAYGSLTWSMCAALRLAAHRGLVLLHTDHKKLFLHTLVVLITGAKATSPAVLMEVRPPPCLAGGTITRPLCTASAVGASTVQRKGVGSFLCRVALLAFALTCEPTAPASMV